MSSDLEEFLDHVDQWIFKFHDKLKRVTPTQRKAFWKHIREDARARGLTVVEPEKSPKHPPKRVRRTG
jgi:hypothetical protein